MFIYYDGRQRIIVAIIIYRRLESLFDIIPIYRVEDGIYKCVIAQIGQPQELLCVLQMLAFFYDLKGKGLRIRLI